MTLQVSPQFHAMDTLHKSMYDVAKAISALVPQGGPVLCRDEMEEWSASEASLFEEALEKYGKDFTDIQQDFVSLREARGPPVRGPRGASPARTAPAHLGVGFRVLFVASGPPLAVSLACVPRKCPVESPWGWGAGRACACRVLPGLAETLGPPERRRGAREPPRGRTGGAGVGRWPRARGGRAVPSGGGALARNPRRAEGTARGIESAVTGAQRGQHRRAEGGGRVVATQVVGDPCEAATSGTRWKSEPSEQSRSRASRAGRRG